jgi:hypothetical protein
MSTPTQTTLAAEEYPPRRSVIEGQILKSVIFLNRNSVTNIFQNRKTEFRTEVNLNKKECIYVISPLR